MKTKLQKAKEIIKTQRVIISEQKKIINQLLKWDKWTRKKNENLLKRIDSFSQKVHKLLDSQVDNL